MFFRFLNSSSLWEGKPVRDFTGSSLRYKEAYSSEQKNGCGHLLSITYCHAGVTPVFGFKTPVCAEKATVHNGKEPFVPGKVSRCFSFTWRLYGVGISICW